MSEPYKPTATWYAVQAQKYLGVPYGTGKGQLDCQALMEKMLQDVGIYKNWAGSNAMWRDLAWRGTPEECRKVFGHIPVGAWLFVWKDDGGEKKRGYKDNDGNASHVGVYTGQGKGATAASATKGKVAESKFEGKSINGGWNRVGLNKLLDYGDDVMAKLRELKEGGKTMQGTTPTDLGPVTTAGEQRWVWLPEGKTGTVNLRKTPNGRLETRLSVGTEVRTIAASGKWTQVAVGDAIGWIMTEYLSPVKPEATTEQGLTVQVNSEVRITLPRDVCQLLLDKLKEVLG